MAFTFQRDRFILLWVFYIFNVMLMALPASAFSIFKYFLLLLLLIATILAWHKNVFSTTKKRLLAFICIALCGLSSVFLGFMHGEYGYGLRAFLGYFGMVFIAGLNYELIRSRAVTFECFVESVFDGMLIYSFGKMIVFAILAFGIIDPFTFCGNIREYVPGIATQIFVVGANRYFVRIGLGNDIVLCFVVFLYLARKNIGVLNYSSIKGFILLSTAIINTVLSTTRAFLIELAVGVPLYILMLNPKRRKIAGLWLLVAAGIIGAALLSSDELLLYLQSRMNDSASIDMKTLQNTALIDEWANWPVFGKGLGAFTYTIIRTNELPFQYEVQWTSILLQIGAFGVLIVALVHLYIVAAILKPINRISLTKAFFLWLYFMFLLSGFTNPYLFILNVYAIYVSCYSVIFRQDCKSS